MTNWTAGDVSLSQILQDADHLYPSHINELRSNMPFENIKKYGAVGDGVTDDTGAFESVFATGSKTVYVPAGTYIVDGIANITVSGLKIIGDGKEVSIIKIKDSATQTNGGVFTFVDVDFFSVRDLTLDANVANNEESINGIFIDSCNHFVIENNTIKNTSRDGILVNYSGSSAVSSNFFIRNNRFSNIGSSGLELIWVQNGVVDGNSVVSSGGTGILTWAANADYANKYSSDMRITNNYVTRSTPPTYVYGGGGVETGYLIGIGPSDRRIIVSGNVCVDNRNTGNYDGIACGSYEGGTVISNNYVSFVAGYGIDGGGDCVVDSNVVLYAKLAGIVALMDSDSTNIVGCTISNNIISGTGYGSTGGTGIIIGGPGVSNVYKVKVLGNTVYDFAAPQTTSYGIYINSTAATLDTVEVSNNDFRTVATASFQIVSTNLATLITSNNWLKVPQKALTGATPSILGQEDFYFSNVGATTVTNLTGGYDQKVVRIMFADVNTTINNGGNFVLSTASITGAIYGTMTFQYNETHAIWIEIARTIPA